MDAHGPDLTRPPAHSVRRRAGVLFGERLREMREGAGWTQAELAAASKLSVSAVQKLEYGDRRPLLETVLLVCRALGVRPGEVVDAVDAGWEVEP